MSSIVSAMLIKLVQLFCELCNPESSVCVVFCMTRSSVGSNLHLDVTAAGYQILATKTKNINWRFDISMYIYTSDVYVHSQCQTGWMK